MEPEYSTFCTTWTSWLSPAISNPWYNYIVKIPDSALDVVSIGDYVESYTYNVSPDNGLIEPLRILSIVYKDNLTNEIYTVDGPGRTKSGVLLLDANNVLLTFLPPTDINYPVGGYNGNICFYQIENSEDIEAIECFEKLVWKLQNQFSKCVEKYLNQLNFGMTCCSMLESLKQMKRGLDLLNRYDVRDIPNDTTDYNDWTYTEIKSILNKTKAC